MIREQLIEQLLAEQSRRNIDLVVHWAFANPISLELLVEMALSNSETVSARAAWVLDKMSEKEPGCLQSFIPQIILAIKKVRSSSVNRALTKVLMLHAIPEEYDGEILDFSLLAIEKPSEAIAVKANSMTLAFRLLHKYPELKNEVFALIEQQIPHSAPAIGARYHVLKKKYFSATKKS